MSRGEAKIGEETFSSIFIRRDKNKIIDIGERIAIMRAFKWVRNEFVDLIATFTFMCASLKPRRVIATDIGEVIDNTYQHIVAGRERRGVGEEQKCQ